MIENRVFPYPGGRALLDKAVQWKKLQMCMGKGGLKFEVKGGPVNETVEVDAVSQAGGRCPEEIVRQMYIASSYMQQCESCSLKSSVARSELGFLEMSCIFNNYSVIKPIFMASGREAAWDLGRIQRPMVRKRDLAR